LPSSFEPIDPRIKPFECFARGLKHLDPGPDGLKVLYRSASIKLTELSQIHFREQHDIASIEQSWVLQWFIFPLGHTEQTNAERFT
jgi:hypothetical protein